MMNQKIHNIKNKDIERLIKREFPNKSISEIEFILRQYASESKRGRNRVYASILKLSNGNIEELIKNVELANKDFRDIISTAEYPNYLEDAFKNDLTKEKEKQLIEEDWKQFKKWIDKK